VSALMNLRVPQKAGNFLTSWQTVSLSRRTLLHGVSKYMIIWTAVVYWFAYYISSQNNSLWSEMLALICMSRKNYVTTSVTLMTGVLLMARVEPIPNSHPPSPPLSLSLSLSLCPQMQW
jgi:hypothetical protein